MSKYKVGDKVVFTVTGMFGDVEYQYYALNKDFSVWDKTIDKYSELLSTYTEPLEVKIRRQAAEITRLLAENERLKPNYENIRAVGQNEAWELARKIVLKNGYSGYDLHEIFNCCGSHQALEDFTYPEAAAKVAEWEKTKEEIEVGDVVESNNGNGERIAVIDVWSSFDGLHFEGISSNGTLTIDASAKYYTKTGRHIDIDSFLKQIRGE